MRQAGRWDPEFRRIRRDTPFFEFAENAELAAQASLCPLRFGVDAIILFYDITTLAISMGQRFELVPGRGPVPDQPIQSASDVDKLNAEPHPSTYHAVLETLRLVRKELDDQLPVLGFAGAPYTVATYQIGTGKDVDKTRAFICEQPATWRSLLEKNTQATIAFLNTLVEEGIAAYQLFDSWAGVLGREEYQEFAQPFHHRIFTQVSGPSILFVKECPYLDLQVRSGADVVSLGKSHDLRSALEDYPEMVFQGNVDHELLIDRSPEAVARATSECLKQGGGHRHILNLDHGMDRRAQPENFAAFVETGKSYRS